MDIEKSYDIWANSYDADQNLTRDLESVSLRQTLSGMVFDTCLELGCGTGKNTAFLKEIAKSVLAVDFSTNMLKAAKARISDVNVQFHLADISADWNFINQPVHLIVCSLVLEHMQQVKPIFEKAYTNLLPGGCFYIGELHPFKQYTGSHARFENESGRFSLKCFTHHLSEYTQAASETGFQIEIVNEFFDNASTGIPRILTLLLKK